MLWASGYTDAPAEMLSRSRPLSTAGSAVSSTRITSITGAVGEVRRVELDGRAPRLLEVDRGLGAPVRLRRHERHEAGGVVGGVLAHPEVVELGDPLLGGGVADHDHPPRLAVPSVRREAGVVEDLVQHVVGERIVGELPGRRCRAHCLAEFHARSLALATVDAPAARAQGRQISVTTRHQPIVVTDVGDGHPHERVVDVSRRDTSAVAATGPERMRLRKRMSRSTVESFRGSQRPLGRDLREQRLRAALDRARRAVADPRMGSISIVHASASRGRSRSSNDAAADRYGRRRVERRLVHHGLVHERARRTGEGSLDVAGVQDRLADEQAPADLRGMALEEDRSRRRWVIDQ